MALWLRQVWELLASARLRPFEAIGLMGLGGGLWIAAVEGTVPPWAPGWIGWPIAIIGIAMLIVGAFLMALEIRTRWPQGLHRETIDRASAVGQSRTVVRNEPHLAGPSDDDAYKQGLRDGLRIALDQLRDHGPTEVAHNLIARAIGDDVLEIRDAVTATITLATLGTGGDVISDPPSAAPLVGNVLQAFAERASATGQAFDATVSAVDGPISRPADPQSPDKSTHDR